ncbi:ABC transporter substrate-binding protein [Pusillimonas noertemannii]|uniref:Branched-chain amino acid transport system substrate-binding protein n=1 Tax=Pusillimonas noertemannii TaxID=305977 RepID=A0A2U1CIU3_9BURK|nr:ABC transporter substrate-binding protein [Pusillimonas noertemannii]NYT70750.1 ABC transporter substrate-binding protein [Pusillimonas noertemannii]PVY60908.1 branched-chain amino acid transport system substrate-binding protein [Pusillimonas noertemannii]TFL08504.1 ABC transporter substrate-binding protein [Pusillimonas noertemannii]
MKTANNRIKRRNPLSTAASQWLGAVLLAALPLAVSAQEPVDIGFIGTLSTPAGYIGEDERDAVLLAIKEEGGKLGGIPVNLIVEDDGFKPATGKQIAEKMLQAGVRIFTGINWSNVLVAAVPTIVKEDGRFYISLNAGASTFAGKGCNRNFFSVAMQNDSYSDTAALAANELGVKKIVVMAPNYQAGRDALTGFKNVYKGEILAEIYTKLDQSDFSVELARIRSLQPEGLFAFLPGGPGINFAKQLANSGLSQSIKMVMPLYSMDDRMLAATGDAGEGYYLTTQWTSQQDNEASKAFVAAFEKEYGRRPTVYAATSYDTARLIGSALKAVNGDVKGKPDAFREALRKADFESVRGNFKFNTNHYPIQDWYLVKVERNSEGKLDYKAISTIAKDHTDPYVSQCEMK